MGQVPGLCPLLDFALRRQRRPPACQALALESVEKQSILWGFPGGAVVKNPPANAGDTGSDPDPGRFHMLWSN